MTEFTFSTGAKSAAGVKVILTSAAASTPESLFPKKKRPRSGPPSANRNLTAKRELSPKYSTAKPGSSPPARAPGQTRSTCRFSAANSIRKSAAKKPPPFSFPPTKRTRFPAGETAAGIALGIELGGYRFDKYFTKKPADSYPKLEKVEFLSENANRR